MESVVRDLKVPQKTLSPHYTPFPEQQSVTCYSASLCSNYGTSGLLDSKSNKTMSLSFLAKKNFHTTNIKNVEEVWLREQAKEAEDKKLLELKNQYEKEKELEKLEEAQDKALGKRSAKQKSKLAWMYQGPQLVSQHESNIRNEQVLNGEITAESFLSNAGDAGRPAKKNRLESRFTANEKFRTMHEDPLFMMRRMQQEKINKIRSNPLRMKEAKLRAMELLEKEIAEDEKKSKKRKKKKKKSHKVKKEKEQKSGDDAHHSHRRRRRSHDRERDSSHSHRRAKKPRLSPEEMKIKLEEMASNGEAHHKSRHDRYHESKIQKQQELSKIAQQEDHDKGHQELLKNVGKTFEGDSLSKAVKSRRNFNLRE